MKDHRSSRLRLLGGTAAVTLLAGVTAMLGSPGIAHPHPEGEAKEHSRAERIVIMTERSDGKGGEAHSGHAGRDPVAAIVDFSVRRGEGGEVVVPQCDPADRTEVNEGTDTDRTRVVLCTRGGATPAQRADRLQSARDRIAGNDELSQEHRNRITAALDREIARLRGQ